MCKITHTVLCDWKKMKQSEMPIFLSIFVQMKRYFRWESGRIIRFFPRINELIGRLLQQISAKIHFFTFFKSCKKSTLTSIFAISKNWLYDFSWVFEIQVKHSIAIFSAIQNSIWTRFKESRKNLKMFIFALIHDFFYYIFYVLCI